MQGLNLNPAGLSNSKIDTSSGSGNDRSVGDPTSSNSFGEILNGQMTTQKVSGLKTTRSQTNPEIEERPPVSVQDQTENLKPLLKQAFTLLEDLKNQNGALTSDQEQIIGQLNALLQKLSESTSSRMLISGKEKDLLKNLEGSLLKKTGLSSSSDSPNSELTSLLVALQHLFPIHQPMGQPEVPVGEASAKSSTTYTNLSGSPLTFSSKQGDRVLTLTQAKRDSESITSQKVSRPLSQSTNNKPDALSSLKNTKQTGLAGLSLGNQTGHDQNQAQDSKTKENPIANSIFVGGRDMGKVQQFVFFSQQNSKQSVSSPADQIANQIKQLLSQGALKNSDGQMSVQLNLHPNNLGAIQLTLTQTDSGLSASILAHSEGTKDLIKSQLTHLEQSLAASGIPVQKLDVNLTASTGQNANDQAYQQQSQEQPQQQQEQGNRAYRAHSSQERDEDDLFDQETFENWLQEVNGR